MTAVISNWINPSRISRISKTAVRSVQTANLARKVLGCSSLAVAFVRCDKAVKKTEVFKPENLTHDQCIKQACLLSVNSASTLLTTTSTALLDICKSYKDSLNKILFLLEAVQANEGDNPELWDAIVEARVHVNKAKAALTELNSYMESVEKVVTSTTEAAFLAGAEYMCTALCERLYSAQREISNQIVDLKKLEEDYLKMQQEIASGKDKENEKNKGQQNKDHPETKKKNVKVLAL